MLLGTVAGDVDDTSVLAYPPGKGQPEPRKKGGGKLLQDDLPKGLTARCPKDVGGFLICRI